jgi:hypothetical protein
MSLGERMDGSADEEARGADPAQPRSKVHAARTPSAPTASATSARSLTMSLALRRVDALSAVAAESRSRGPDLLAELHGPRPASDSSTISTTDAAKHAGR